MPPARSPLGSTIPAWGDAGRRGTRLPTRGSGLRNGEPLDLDFLFQGPEFGIARDERGFLLLREGRGEGVGQAQAMAGLKVGGEIGEVAVGGVEADGKGGKACRDVFPTGGSVFAQHHVFHLGVVDLRHMHGGVAISRAFEEGGDGFRAWFSAQEREQGEAIEDGRNSHRELPVFEFQFLTFVVSPLGYQRGFPRRRF